MALAACGQRTAKFSPDASHFAQGIEAEEAEYRIASGRR